VPGITKKDRPLTAQHFSEFEKAYGKDPNGLSKRTEGERFRRYPASSIKDRDYKLDVTWLKDDSLEDADELPEPQDLAAEAITELEAGGRPPEIVALVEKQRWRTSEERRAGGQNRRFASGRSITTVFECRSNPADCDCRLGSFLLRRFRNYR
jgi:hypothetical protein